MRRTAILVLLVMFAAGCASRAGYDADTTRTCPAHGLSLRDDTVPILYGLPAELVDEGYAETRRELFPYANTWTWGGCVTIKGELRPRSAKVRYCPQCRANYAPWLEQKEREWRARTPPQADNRRHGLARLRSDCAG